MSGALRLTGATRLYMIIGDPIVQVRSPEVYTREFVAAGMDAVMLPVHVPRDRFDLIVPALLQIANLDGLLVTVPFKPRMVPFVQHLGTTARTIGAVNTMRREADGTWSGEMFDGQGFVRGIERKGRSVKGRRVVQFGAGGAGSAIACALAQAGVASIRLIDPEQAHAERLVDALRAAFPTVDLAVAIQVPPEFDMVVNASPVGMRPDDPLPSDIGALAHDTIVGDVVISPTPTAIVRHAMHYGSFWVDGSDLHSGQIDAIIAFFAATAPSAAGR